jgi:stage II sporulation protein D
MVSRRKATWAALCAAVVLALPLNGCRIARRPGPGTSDGAAPVIPQTIARGPRQEPTISLYIAETGSKTTLPIEQYIEGVVAAEMKPSWPANALAAQAILARTFTLERISKTPTVAQRGANASTSVEEFQAYDASKINDAVRQAVRSTRGQVVGYQGKFINAWFHSYSGGATATAQAGLDYTQEPTPYAASVKDVAVPDLPPDIAEWTAEFTTTELAEAMRKAGKTVEAVDGVTVSRRDENGRATAIKVGGVETSAPEMRLALGSTKLRSTFISEITSSGGRVVFKGKGFGHGVGMSQWGAKTLADQGKSAAEIINYYFKGVSIHKIWD